MDEHLRQRCRPAGNAEHGHGMARACVAPPDSLAVRLACCCEAGSAGRLQLSQGRCWRTLLPARVPGAVVAAPASGRGWNRQAARAEPSVLGSPGSLQRMREQRRTAQPCVLTTRMLGALHVGPDALHAGVARCRHPPAWQHAICAARVHRASHRCRCTSSTVSTRVGPSVLMRTRTWR